MLFLDSKYVEFNSVSLITDLILNLIVVMRHLLTKDNFN